MNSPPRTQFSPVVTRAAQLVISGLLVVVPVQLHAGFSDDWAKMKPIVPNSYVCYRASGPVFIDGRLEEAAWKGVPWTSDFVDIEGDAKPKPRLRTRAKMLWDDSYFFIAAELEEPHVWGTLAHHDAVIFQDNDFEVFIDPDSDNHEYYEFEINALNTGWDLFLEKPYKDGGTALNEWEIPGLKTAVQVRGTLNNPADIDQAWTVEIALPWNVLAEHAHRPAPPRDNDQWRVNFSRVEWLADIDDGKYRKVPGKREDNWVWSPQGIIDMHRPEKWGYVRFATSKVASVHPDPTLPARDLLHQIYYAQRDFHEQHKHWARSLEELRLAEARRPKSVRALEMKPTPHGFEAIAEVKLFGGRIRRLHIQQDARIWME